MSQPSLLTISVFRRGYGRRYTDLPVDAVASEGLRIDFVGGYLTPERIDLRAGDLVRWREGERYVEARVAAVRREGPCLSADLVDATLLPEDYFPY